MIKFKKIIMQNCTKLTKETVETFLKESETELLGKPVSSS